VSAVTNDRTARGVISHWLAKYPNIDTQRLFRIFKAEIADKHELKEAVIAETFERALADVTQHKSA
jgi:hypothetical protein